MNKKELCMRYRTVGYWSELGGVELKHIEYGINDYAYVVDNAWYGIPSYHIVKINYSNKGSYIRLYDYRLYFDDCVRC